MAFLKESDYNVQLRTEIGRIIDPTAERVKILGAEKMAIAQIRNHLAGRYDVAKIFIDAPEDGAIDLRDQYIVMIAIDMALYHLWSKEGSNNIPKNRELRYNDALKWLQDVQGGKAADLPPITDEGGTVSGDVRIYSQRTQGDNQY
jgi:phage gp36-like protein